MNNTQEVYQSLSVSTEDSREMNFGDCGIQMGDMKTSLGYGDAEVAVFLSNLFQSLAIPTIPSHCKSSRFCVLFFSPEKGIFMGFYVLCSDPSSWKMAKKGKKKSDSEKIKMWGDREEKKKTQMTWIFQNWKRGG